MPILSGAKAEASLTRTLVTVYIALVTIGTGLSGAFGPEVSVLTSFGMVGPILTIRDKLHDRWLRARFSRRGAVKMFAMIGAGGVASLSVNLQHPYVAIASVSAFGVSELLDTLVYWRLRRYQWFERVSVSNLVSSAADSLIFPSVAFLTILPAITTAQFSAKVAGGVIVTLWMAPRRSSVRYRPIQ